jgi:pimeloyl-ACP methyl ester carboxylesterase
MRSAPPAPLAALAALVLLASACGSGSSDPGVSVGGSDDRTEQGTDDTTPSDSTPGDSTPGETTPGDTTPGDGPVVGSIDWEECGDGIECGTLEVPRDHEDPDAGTVELALVRHLARDSDNRIGSLLVNPGGPGYGGSFLAEQASFIYSEGIIDRFDVVGFDPRGTGDSTPAVDCVDEYDPYFGLDPSPDDDGEKDALVDSSEEFGQLCLERSGEILPYISTEFAARDMDLIRQALGEETISYFGFSYGSELGAVWATLFPETVRAAVLDGAADPNNDYTEGGLAQAVGFEQQLTTFLARCSEDEDCAFHNDGDAEGAFDQLMLDLDAEPLEVSTDRTPVTQGVASIAVANALYGEFLWPDLEDALARAQDGAGDGLLGLYDDYLDRESDGTYGDAFEAFISITCLDDPGPRSVEAADAEAQRFLDAAPRLGSFFASGYTCALWPIEPHGKVSVTGAGAGPIVVVGTTGDAATPLESTRAMAETLEDGRLIIVTADQHTGYNVNDCINDAIDDYLIDLEPPDDGLECD